ncbi:hypothetical protein BDW72DRAFT_181310 [Aspergillus terricola var. indicus]
MEVDIDQWVNDIYSGGHKYRYEQHAKEVQKICQEALENGHIQHVISWRAKSEDSLRAKLKKMKEANKLKWTQETIFKRVFDIAGVRIAYYLPTEKDLITHIIEQGCRFRIVSRDTKVYGDSSSTRGDSLSTQAEMMKPTYRATHWIVHLPDEKKYPLPVEIQVMSVLASAWAQIQHDYTYKPFSPDISAAELYNLQEFGHSVAVSERFLDQLGRLRKQREEEKFEDTYNLGLFLFQWWRKHYGDVEDLGSLSALLRLLKKTEETRANLNTRRQLSSFLRDHVTPPSVDGVKAQYLDIEVRPAVFIMHFIIENREDLVSALEEGHRDELVCRDKLEIIMDTIMWLSEFFPSADWEKPFSLEGNRGDKGFKQLPWLTSAKPGRLLNHPDDFNRNIDDRKAVNEIWEWFKCHENPPVRLAWRISNAGIRRDAAKEVKRFHRVFMALGRKIKAELNYQPL